MQIYSQLHSVLNKNGKKYLVNVYEWAEMTLTGDRLAQYLADKEEFDAHFNNYLNSSEITPETIYSSVKPVDNLKMSIVIGNRITWQNEIDQHPKFEYWLQEFANDPNIEYQPLIREL